MLRSVLTIILTLGLTACATKPTPPLFQGQSGWKTLPNTTKLVATNVDAGEMIAEKEIEFIRTGTLKTDVKNMLGIVKMKAGSPVYAASYGGSGYSFGSLAWCAPGGSKNNLGSFLTGENDVECLMFNSRTGGAVRTDGSGASRFFARNMSAGSSAVVIPEIEEGPVDFGRRLTLRLMASSLTGKTMEGIVNFHDGEDQTLLQQTRLTFDEDGTTSWNIWGGELKLTRTGSEDAPKVAIEQIKPFSSYNISNETLLQIVNALKTQAALSENMNDGTDK